MYPTPPPTMVNVEFFCLMKERKKEREFFFLISFVKGINFGRAEWNLKKSEPICSTEGLSNDYNGTKVIDWFVVYLAKTKSFLVYRKRKMKVDDRARAPLKTNSITCVFI